MAEERRLVLRTVDVQMPSVAVSGLANSLDPREHTYSKQQCCYIIDQPPARRRIVNSRPAERCIPTHRSIGRPEMPEKKRYLIRWQCENWLRHKLFITPLAEQPELIQPCGDRITSTVRQPVRRGQPQRCD